MTSYRIHYNSPASVIFVQQVSSLNLYNSLLTIFIKLAPLFAVFSPKLKSALAVRKKNNSHYLLNTEKTKKRVWFHCSSYGEFEGILPLLNTYASRENHSILVSFFSSSGFEPLHTHPQIDYCFYLPFDTRQSMRALLKNLDPDVLLISQNEYWPNLIHESLAFKIPIYYISTYVRPNHWWLKQSFVFLTKPLRQVNQIFLQDQLSHQLLTDAGYQNCLLAGNTRVDQAIQNAKVKKDYPQVEDFISGSQALVCGSTLPADETLIFNVLDDVQGIKLILVPHDPSQFELQQIPDRYQTDTCYLSQYTNEDTEKSILIVDSVGDLKYLYRYAHIAYVGGGFDEGVHSVLEAAVYEIPILTGPHIHKFKDAVNLADMEVLKIVHNRDELAKEIRRSKEGFSSILKQKLKIYLSENSGATRRMLDLIRF